MRTIINLFVWIGLPIWNNERQKCHLMCSLIYIFQIRLRLATTNVTYRLVHNFVCITIICVVLSFVHPSFRWFFLLLRCVISKNSL